MQTNRRYFLMAATSAAAVRPVAAQTKPVISRITLSQVHAVGHGGRGVSVGR